VAEDESVNVQPSPWVTVKVRPAMVSVPLRAGPVVAAAAYWTSPLPLPLEPDEIVSHGALLDAVQPQPFPALTVTLPLDPAEGGVADSGEIVNAHPGDCVMATRCPAMVTLPERAGPEVDVTPTVTVPSPVPDDRPCSVIQSSLAVDCHSHSRFAATLKESVPPEAPTCPEEGWTTYAHPCDCVTVKISPATMAVPTRDPPVVGATLNATEAVPRPEAGVTEIQVTFVAAVHGHAGDVVMAIAPLAPDGATDLDAGAIAKVQPSD
jgi:hypothetical protein